MAQHTSPSSSRLGWTYRQPSSLSEMAKLQIKKWEIPLYMLPGRIRESLENYFTDEGVDRCILFQRHHRMSCFDVSYSDCMKKAYDELLVEFFTDAILNNREVQHPVPPTWVRCICQQRALLWRQNRLKAQSGCSKDGAFLINFYIDVMEKFMEKTVAIESDEEAGPLEELTRTSDEEEL